ncbi:flagellar biosynthesis anti-sigma factor FlgM [Sphingomonas sp.]|uniref:flagellar biosynthesis anti-sigma factor FlgM n=1 Tax=Sphingomonas sp. TaxID=28214 RepID=UPI003B00DD4A
MLNGIGSSTSSPIGTQRGGDAKRVDVAGTRTTSSGEGGIATTVGRIAAEGPPIETDRVAALRAAIRGGTYMADPDAIATKMIAGDLL